MCYVGCYLEALSPPVALNHVYQLACLDGLVKRFLLAPVYIIYIIRENYHAILSAVLSKKDIYCGILIGVHSRYRPRTAHSF